MKWIKGQKNGPQPKKGQIVVAWLKKAREPRCLRVEEDKHGSLWVELTPTDADDTRGTDLVTHWMPLPPPPQEE